MPSLSTFPLAAVLAQARSLAGSSQVRSGLSLSAVGAGSLGVTVAAGTAWVDGTYVSSVGGTVTPGAASATLARYDLIVIASGAVVPSIVAGTAASAPVPAALPAGALFLGYVFIGPGATDYTVQATAFIADYTMPVTLPTGTAAGPANPPTGDLDTGWAFPGADRIQTVTGGVARNETTSAGDFVPVSTSIDDLGTSTLRWRDVNAVSIRADAISTGTLVMTGELAVASVSVSTLHVTGTASVQELIVPWPRCRVFNSAIITVASGSVALTFDSERFDPASMHSSTANTGRITFTTSGYYIIGGNVQISSTAAGGQFISRLGIRLNGVASLTIALTEQTIANELRILNVNAPWYASVSGDYAELMVYNQVATSVIFVDDYSPEFWALRVG